MSMENKTQKKKKEKKIYRLLILEEKTYKPLWSFQLSKVNVLFYFGGGFIILMLIFFVLFRFTSLSSLIYTNTNSDISSKIYIDAQVKLDSLASEIDIMHKYFNKLNYILSGKNLDSIAIMDSSGLSALLLTNSEHDSILKQLKATSANFSQMQEVINSNTKYKNLHFTKPLDGVISNNFNPADGHYGIDIVAPEKTPVVSVLSGTVILATWSLNSGYIIEIQHANNIISVYKHNAELLKHEGDRVAAGEPIALVGNTGEQTSGTHLHFELWIDGVPVNPTNYIVF